MNGLHYRVSKIKQESCAADQTVKLSDKICSILYNCNYSSGSKPNSLDVEEVEKMQFSNKKNNKSPDSVIAAIQTAWESWPLDFMYMSFTIIFTKFF